MISITGHSLTRVTVAHKAVGIGGIGKIPIPVVSVSVGPPGIGIGISWTFVVSVSDGPPVSSSFVTFGIGSGIGWISYYRYRMDLVSVMVSVIKYRYRLCFLVSVTALVAHPKGKQDYTNDYQRTVTWQCSHYNSRTQAG